MDHMNIFEMWIYGVKIILSFIPVGMAMILLPALIFFAFDNLLEAISGESMFANIFFDCKTYEEVWEKFKQKIRQKFKKG